MCVCVWAHLVLYAVTMDTVLACVCVSVCALFLSASLFVGWPSHLFHSYICDLPGSDWYGNIIIQARILSLPSLTLSLALSFPLFITLISFTTNKFSVSHLSLSVPLAPSLTSKQLTPLLSSLLFNTAFLACLMALYFFLHWVIHLEAQNPAELLPYLLGERWGVSHNQSPCVQCRDGQKTITTPSTGIERSLWTT